MSRTEPQAPWVPCPCCEDYLCTIHGAHVHDCPCPPIEELETDPYSAPATSRKLPEFQGKKIDDSVR